MGRYLLKTFNTISFLAILLLQLICFSCKNDTYKKSWKHKGRVVIKKENGKFSFFKDGVPFTVKGGAGFTYLKELAEAGGNTIKTWDTSKLSSILDDAQINHLNVIVGLDIPRSDLFDSFYS